MLSVLKLSFNELATYRLLHACYSLNKIKIKWLLRYIEYKKVEENIPKESKYLSNTKNNSYQGNIKNFNVVKIISVKNTIHRVKENTAFHLCFLSMNMALFKKHMITT